MKSVEFINEAVNSEVFKRGFTKTKSFTGKNGIEYSLVATHGALPYIPGKKAKESDQFRIEALANGTLVGWVNFKITDSGFGPKNLRLEAIDVKINKPHTRKGVASAMYKFAEELGNDIMPSSMQTPDGKAFWAGKK